MALEEGWCVLDSCDNHFERGVALLLSIATKQMETAEIKWIELMGD